MLIFKPFLFTSVPLISKILQFESVRPFMMYAAWFWRQKIIRRD